MSDEIKEILKILKKCEFGACITKHDSRVLLDYITNLQELNRMCELYCKSLYNAELIDYKSRIDKAIEYLEQPYRDDFDYSKAELLNILNDDK